MGELILGDYSYSFAERRGNSNTIKIGSYSCVAENTIFDSGFNHRTDFISTFPFHQKVEGLSHLPSNVKECADIEIGSDVWIGEGCVIFGGIKISHGAIIGCHSVVTKDVAPYTIVGGVPAKFIRNRFLKDQQTALMKIMWWNWPEEKIKENAHLLQSDNIEEFLKVHG